MMGMESPNPKRNSIIHVQNAILSGLENILPVRETDKYIIAYEQKSYRIHYLLYKIARQLAKGEANYKQVDINIREDYRWRIKMSDTKKETMKNVTVRIVPTRYQSYSAVYAKFITLKWRKTGKGGITETRLNISQCPMIANSSDLNDICYKKVANQVSGYGTHGLTTYIVLSPKAGVYTIGKQEILSNSGKTYLELPVTVEL